MKARKTQVSCLACKARTMTKSAFYGGYSLGRVMEETGWDVLPMAHPPGAIHAWLCPTCAKSVGALARQIKSILDPDGRDIYVHFDSLVLVGLPRTKAKEKNHG